MDYDNKTEAQGVWIRPSKDVKESDIPELNEELATALKGAADDLAFHLYMIDRALARYKEALALVQPHATGRIDIKYWQGKLPGKHPYAIAWKCLGPGRSLPLPKGHKKSKAGSLEQRTSPKLVYGAFKLKTGGLAKRAKRSGKFLESLEKTRFILGKVDTLLTMRANVVENMRRFRISLSKAMDHQNAVMQEMADELDKLMPEWRAYAESRYDELSELRSDHIKLLEQDELIQAKRGYSFGGRPGKK